jgi:hypothetical protein
MTRLSDRRRFSGRPFPILDVRSLQSGLNTMQVSRVMAHRMRLAVLVIVLSLLLTLALVLLYISVGFGFAAGEVMANPNAAPDANAALKRAANLGLALFAAVLILFAGVVIQSGVLKAKFHWAARASGAFVLAAITSYLAMYAMLAIGGWPRPLADLGRALAEWIQQQGASQPTG